jgi:hypothetical protein
MDWFSLFSTVLQGVSQYEQGRAAKAGQDFQAGQLEQRAGQLRAAGQRSAIEERRRAAIVGSALQARAGGGGSDPTIVRLAQDIAGEGEYRALTALYHGEDQAVGDEMQAGSKRYQGADAMRAGGINASAALLAGGYSLYEKYGGGRLEYNYTGDSSGYKNSPTGDAIRGRR